MATIGEKLKEARITKGLSIDELQQATKIQKRYLQALEEDEYDAMPGTFYVRAFIRQYAAAVDLDGDMLVRAYDGKVIDLDKIIERAPETINGSRKELHRESQILATIKARLPLIILSILALAIIIVVIVMTVQDNRNNPMIERPTNLQSESESASSEADSSESLASSKEESTSSSSTANSTTSSSESKKNEVTFLSEIDGEANMQVENATSPITLAFKGTNGPCWVGVYVNGSVIYDYTLQAGGSQETTLPAGATNATVVLGASGNVTISLNEKKLNFDPNQTGNVKKNINLSIEYGTATETSTTSEED